MKSTANMQTGIPESKQSFFRDEPPDNSILRPMAFASKTLSTMGKRYSKIKKEALGIQLLCKAVWV